MNYAIILAGGIGSRFWPLSRRHLPKQFLRILKNKSLFESTVRRTRRFIADKNIFIVTNIIYRSEILNQLKNFKVPKENIILEPKPWNTLPAIALCAQFIYLKDPQSNLLVLPSDHYIKNEIRFKEDMLRALRVSQVGLLCLVGIKPDRLRLGYGLIEIGKKMKPGIFDVVHFIEKPALDKARILLGKKNIYWNSGILAFKAKSILREIKMYNLRLYQQIASIKNRSDIAKHWPRIKPVSIDYGILEHSKNLVTLLGRFSWSDLGSWEALFEILPKNKNKNAILSDLEHLSLDTINTLIYSYNQKKLIATVGLRDLIIVDTPDALMVCKKEKTQEIKKLVELLQKKGKLCV